MRTIKRVYRDGSVLLKGEVKMAAASADKAPNYTPEMVETIKAEYAAGVPVAEIAEKVGKTTRSIIAKLSKEGVYKAKEYVSKTGEKPVKKDETADAIGKVLGLSEGDTDSLAKANKRALVAIFKALAESKPI